MSKETYFFSHDYHARNDPKLQKVLMRLGQEGIGVYWCLIEMCFEEGGYLLITEIESYAFALRTNANCIISLINDFGLFEKTDTRFWSESALRRLNLRREKSEKATASANKRWQKPAPTLKSENANASNIDTNALQPQSDSNAIKESKGKESKRNTNNTPTELAVAVIDYLNTSASKNYKANSKNTLAAINARVNEGYVLDDFKKVISGKSAQWKNDPAREIYLRPETLFGNKFEGYLNERGIQVREAGEYRKSRLVT